MSLYTAYCTGSLKGEKSAVSYLIFKNGKFIEENVVQVEDAEKSLRQHVLALKVVVDRLVEIGAENVEINFNSKEVHDRVTKIYNKHIVKKDAIPIGLEKSNVFMIANNLKKFKSFKLNVIPVSHNLRAHFLSRKYIVQGWEHRDFIWKDVYPEA
ncbi:MAG: hypothetical protein K0R18_504 [Bacillales bacterium]|jgi:hypothetical protein|nr:hypothetical protein [Bacillales bacterium]